MHPLLLRVTPAKEHMFLRIIVLRLIRLICLPHPAFVSQRKARNPHLIASSCTLMSCSWNPRAKVLLHHCCCCSRCWRHTLSWRQSLACMQGNLFTEARELKKESQAATAAYAAAGHSLIRGTATASAHTLRPSFVCDSRSLHQLD